MRTRSSRFFVVLLHLVGVSRHLPQHYQGIVGVAPSSIGLEEVQLWHRRRRGRGGATSGSQRQPQEELPPVYAVWLQDAADGSCLGPTAEFAECGDATQWLVMPKRQRGDSSRRPRRRFRMGLFGVNDYDRDDELTEDAGEKDDEESQLGWTFQVPDDSSPEGRALLMTTGAPSKADWTSWSSRRIKRRQSECLFHNRKNGRVQVDRCYQLFKGAAATTWVMKDDGSLGPPEAQRPAVKREGEEASSLCLWRKRLRNNDASSSSATLSLGDCTAANTDSERKVQFSLVRYQHPVSTPSAATSTTSGGGSLRRTTKHTTADVQQGVDGNDGTSGDFAERGDDMQHRQPQQKEQQQEEVATAENKVKPAVGYTGGVSPLYYHPYHHIPSDMAHTKANNPSPLNAKMQLNSKKKKEQRRPHLKVLHDTNPILLMGNNNNRRKEQPHEGGASDMGAHTITNVVRKIETHPYIAASKNEIWKDPQTSLDYFTDLCRYMGWDRKEHGRQTLMGVGQYRKYVIKVYGVAFYVSKRDALAEPKLQPYASLSADELRQRPDFYQLLRSSHNDIRVDRTLFLKTNMQLTAETMRSSLGADWSYLTDEAKETLISASMRGHPADANMLKVIASPDNPSRCSCSSVAPDEYQADPECCARGTELAFTWLKNGDLVVRLNGIIAHVLPRPDIAEGIFYEYLRYDDPISTDFRDRVVDGFPFLLAPLAQVKGVNFGQHPPPQAAAPANPVFRAMSSLTEYASSHAAGLHGMLQRGASGVVAHAGNAAKSLADSASHLGKDLDRRRELLVQHAVALPQTMAKVPQTVAVIPQTIAAFPHTMSKLSQSLANAWATRGEKDPIQVVSEWVAANMTPDEPEEEEEQQVVRRRESLGRAFGYPLSRWFSEAYTAPDEIGLMILPTMSTTRRVFLAFVHVYLLLLLIVSFPGSYTTRTKFLIRKSKTCSSNTASQQESSSVVSDSETEASWFEPSVKEAEPSSLERSQRILTRCRSVPCDGVQGNGKLPQRRGILIRARKALRPSPSEEIQEASVSPANGRLKKKSLSYFL